MIVYIKEKLDVIEIPPENNHIYIQCITNNVIWNHLVSSTDELDFIAYKVLKNEKSIPYYSYKFHLSADKYGDMYLHVILEKKLEILVRIVINCL